MLGLIFTLDIEKRKEYLLIAHLVSSDYSLGIF
jgi:hypothetical protein